MAEDVRIWEIRKNDELLKYEKAKLNLEERIEEWLKRDISVLSSDLLVIGCQVETSFGGYIDLLCLDRDGNTVIVELKRDKTPREITAQTLDYASWVKNLSHAEITAVANNYLGRNGPLDGAFRRHFHAELPEVLNEGHRMLVVGSEIDESTERIIRFLSETYGVGINAATFHYFRGTNGQELLARIFLVQPAEVEANVRATRSSKREPNLTPEELRQVAQQNEVEQLYVALVESLERVFDQTKTTRSSFAFQGRFGDSTKTMFSLLPGQSSRHEGLKFIAYSNRMAEYFGKNEHDVVTLLPASKEPWKYYPSAPPDHQGYSGFFRDPKEVTRFVAGLEKIQER